MKIDVQHLTRSLRRAPKDDIVSSVKCNKYLIERVLRPALRGEAPKLKELDYDEFDEEDISDLADYYETVCEAGKKLEQIMKAVSSIAPIACRSRQFC